MILLSNSIGAYIWIAIWGLVWGSLAGCMYCRLPIQESMFKRSYCPSCKKKLSWYNLIPLISFIIQKGRCGHCLAKIPFYYLLFEIAGFLLAIIVFKESSNILEYLLLFIIWWLLFMNALFDLRWRWFSSHLLLLNLIFIVIYVFLFEQQLILEKSLSMAAASSMFLYLRFIFSTLRNKEMLGEGDVILIGLIALLLGWQAGLAIVFIASCLGIIIIVVLSLFNSAWLQTKVAYGAILIFIAFSVWLFPKLTQIMFSISLYS